MGFIDDLLSGAVTQLRNTAKATTSLNLTPANRSGPRSSGSSFDWVDAVAEAARRAAEERRRREEEQRRIAQALARKQALEQRKAEAEARRVAAEQRAAANKAELADRMAESKAGQEASVFRRAEFGRDNANRFGDSTTAIAAYDAMEKAKVSARAWASSPEGRSFLQGGGKQKDTSKLVSNPLEYLRENSTMKEFQWGTNQETHNYLRQRGVPDDVLSGLRAYLFTKNSDGKVQESDRGGVLPVKERTQGPIYSVTKDLTGNSMAASIASAASAAIPVVGPALYGIESGSAKGSDDPSDPRLWADAANAAGTAVVMGKPLNAIEDIAARTAVQKIGGGAIVRLATKAMTRAGLNVAEDTPLTAATLAAYGINPISEEGRAILATQTALSAAGGAAVPLAGATAKTAWTGAGKVPPELTRAVAAYGGAKVLGADDEEALAYAAIAAGATVAQRKGFEESVKTGFGLTRILPKVEEQAPDGTIRETPVMGGITYNPPDDIDPRAAEIMGIRPSVADNPDFRALDRPTEFRDLAEMSDDELAAAMSRSQMMITKTERQLASMDVPEAQARDAYRMMGESYDRLEAEMVRRQNAGEAGQVNPNLAAGLASSAAGAGIGYAVGDEEGAAIGAGVGLAGGVGALSAARAAGLALRKGVPTSEVADPLDFLGQARLQIDSAAGTRTYKSLVDSVRGGIDAPEIRREFAGILNLPVRMLEVLDPATKYSKSLLTGTLAFGNYVRDWYMERPQIEASVRSALAPLASESGRRRASRLGVEAAPAAFGAAYFSQDQSEKGRVALALGAAGSGALTHYGKDIIKYTGAFENVGYRDDFDSDVPAHLANGQGRLAHILLRPDDFNLTPDQRAAVDAVTGDKGLLARHHDATNAARVAAGLEPVSDRDGNRLFQWFTKESVEKVIGREFFQSKGGTPWFMRDVPIQKQRELGTDIVDAVTRHPELRIDGDVMGLVLRDLDHKATIRANTAIVAALKEDGIKDETGRLTRKQRAQEQRLTEMEQQGRAQPDIDRQRARISRTLDELSAANKAEVAAGRDAAWRSIPGIDGMVFPPKLLDQVEKLATTQDEVTGILDTLTANIRTAMFSMDGSAWTMQGYMLAMNDPIGTVMMAPHLVAATALGDRYTNWWFSRNRDLVRKWTAKGVVPGREFDRMHEKLKLANLPGLQQVETRGFGNFLPIFRISMAEHMSQSSMWIDSVLGAGMALGGAAIATDDDSSDMERAFGAALSGVGIMSSRLPYAAIDKIRGREPDKIETRIAQEINRSSGAFNKQQYGIANKQSSIERTYLFRSPALVRNTFIMTRLALLPGADGQIARAYLAKTALMTAGLLAALKYSATGELDSFDPNDETSVFNPQGFLRANLDGAGKVAPSNPFVSLARAFLTQPNVEGADGDEYAWWQQPDSKEAWSAAIGGLADYFSYRVPDVVGNLYNLGREDSALQGFGDNVQSGNVQGMAQDALRLTTPVSIQAMGEAGLLPDAMSYFFEQNPNVNSKVEQQMAWRTALLGMNWSPETNSQEFSRITDAHIRTKYPELAGKFENVKIRTSDLNAEQRDALAPRLAADKRLKELKDYFDKQEGPASPIDAYIERSKQIQDELVETYRRLEKGVASGDITKQAYRLAVTEAQKTRRTKREELDKEFGSVTMDKAIKDQKTGKVRTDMSVTEYLNNGDAPEDAALTEYFRLDEKALLPDGSLDFEKLQGLQEAFIKNSKHGAYIKRRLDKMTTSGVKDSEGRTVALPTFGELEDLKERAKPFWELRETTFNMMRDAGSPLFVAFGSHDGMEKAIAQMVKDNPGLREDDVYYILRQSADFKLYEKIYDLQGRIMRGEDPTLDYGLTDFYNRAPVNPYGYIASANGDSSLDVLGPQLAVAKKRPTSKERIKFLADYQALDPDRRARNRQYDTSYEFRKTFIE